MLGQPVLAPFREEIVEMPDRGERIDAPVVPGRSRHFGCESEIYPAIGSAAKNADGGTLALFVLREIIAIKRVVVAGEKAHLVPAPVAAPLPQAADLHFGDQDEIHF